jgi:ATP-dependent protease ClpP protease subunit
MDRQMLRLRHDVRMSAEDEAEIMIYSEIVSPGWKWDDSEISALDFDKALKEVKGAKKLVLRINSPGGTATEAVAMRAMLLNAGFPEIEAHVEGLCASAATLLCCLPGAKVIIAEGSYFMVHNPWSIAFGNAEEMERTVVTLRKMEGDFRAIYSKACGQDEDTIRGWMDEETWFTAQEAVDAGFAHEVLAAEPVAACVTPDMMGAMRQMYRCTPQEVAVKEKVRTDEPAVAAGEPAEHTFNSEEETEHMDITNLTMEELQAQNPALFQSLMSAGSEQERQRIQDIDDITLPGYEELAKQAKMSGTSAMDFHKQIVKAQREKGAQFLASRQEETAPAAQVPGGASEDTDGAQTTEQAIQANAQAVANYAKQYRGGSDGTMY